MKVLLINPPATNILRESLPSVVEDDSGVYPPLGLLYVAAYVEEIIGCEVKVLDTQAENLRHEDLTEIIKQFSPDIVGVQVMTFTLIDAILVARTVRQVSSNILIVFGGPHPTIYPKETIQLSEVDAVVPGEGEFIFSALVKSIMNNEPIDNLSGVVTKLNQHIPSSLSHIQELDILKMPARHLVNVEKYNSPLSKKNPLTTIMSSRGCPARCVFCDRPQMGKKFRMRSAKNVVNEIAYCKEEFGISEFLFYDDTFTIDKNRVVDVCDLLISKKLEISWDIRARIDTVSPSMIGLLKKAGCHRIHYGVETGSPDIQMRLKKNLDLNLVDNVFRKTRNEGIEVLGYFMIGCPDETQKDLDLTLDLIHKLPMDYAHIGIFTPYPGTEIYAEALKTGFYDKDHWREFAINPSKNFVPKYWNQYFTDDELLNFMNISYKKFYSRPSYILERLLKVRSFDEFFRKAILGVKLLKSVYYG